MKRIILICTSLIFVIIQLSAQAATDTLYLKNGSIVYGELRIKSKTQYEIKTSDGFLFTFSSQEVEKIVKGLKPSRSSNQVQISPLDMANKNISTGKTFTIIGAVAFVGGIAAAAYTVNRIDRVGGSDNLVALGLEFGLVASGIGALGTGIPKWIKGVNKKKKIELQLVSFKSPGSAPVNGVGFKIWF
jgi:hypothetical protein